MKAIEAMRCNRPMDAVQFHAVQMVIHEISTLSNRIIGDIYSRSSFSMIIGPYVEFPEKVYPQATLEAVREIIELRDAEIGRYLESAGIQVKSGGPGGRKGDS